MGRTDYFNDPAAPTPNSLVVAVVVVVVDGDRVLMIQRTDNGRWALPGGGQELGESVRAAAIRETYEETGIEIDVAGVVGIYSNPQHIIAYDDGEVRQEFAVCLSATPVGGLVSTSAESQRVAWVPVVEIDKLDMSESTLRRIHHAFGGGPAHVD